MEYQGWAVYVRDKWLLLSCEAISAHNMETITSSYSAFFSLYPFFLIFYPIAEYYSHVACIHWVINRLATAYYCLLQSTTKLGPCAVHPSLKFPSRTNLWRGSTIRLPEYSLRSQNRKDSLIKKLFPGVSMLIFIKASHK